MMDQGAAKKERAQAEAAEEIEDDHEAHDL
jgi:hypothetical protein